MYHDVPILLYLWMSNDGLMLAWGYFVIENRVETCFITTCPLILGLCNLSDSGPSLGVALLLVHLHYRQARQWLCVVCCVLGVVVT